MATEKQFNNSSLSLSFHAQCLYLIAKGEVVPDLVMHLGRISCADSLFFDDFIKITLENKSIGWSKDLIVFEQLYRVMQIFAYGIDDRRRQRKRESKAWPARAVHLANSIFFQIERSLRSQLQTDLSSCNERFTEPLQTVKLKWNRRLPYGARDNEFVFSYD